MSSFSRPHSPPETPQKATMAVEKGTVTPKARSFDASRSGDPEPTDESSSKSVQPPRARSFEISSEQADQEQANQDLAAISLNEAQQPRPRSVVQPPSTVTNGDHDEGATTKKIPQLEHISSDISEDPTEDADGHTTDPQAEHDTPTSSNPDEPLQPMDWAEFEIRYQKAMTEANKEEDDLLEEFDAYVAAFSNWAVAPAERDNERGWKRLRTRERYVQLSEARLKEKQEHYSKVVEAFRMALELLKS